MKNQTLNAIFVRKGSVIFDLREAKDSPSYSKDHGSINEAKRQSRSLQATHGHGSLVRW